MTAVLGIDAAWAENNCSGVALINKLETGRWNHVASAPSCQSFIQLTQGHAVNWDAVPRGGAIEPNELLAAIRTSWPELDVKVIAVDIPIGLQPVRAKRCSDRAIDATFRDAKAGTRTPTPTLPGPFSDQLMCKLAQAGYPLKTCDDNQLVRQTDEHKTIEVYPHPAIVRHLRRKCRLPYKVDRWRRYWPKTLLAIRRKKLSRNLHTLHDGLTGKIQAIPADRAPTSAYAREGESLKKFEDTLDALVCAWVGACYIDGNAKCFGDNNAAIWVPTRNADAPDDSP